MRQKHVSERKRLEEQENLEDLYEITAKQAEEFRATLSPPLPSFSKLMNKSHVTTSYSLHLPSNFCATHLPKNDDTLVLLSQNGQEYKLKYRANSTALGGGWKAFSIAHKLLEGDVVVFQLIEPCKFKVNIVRARKETSDDDDYHYDDDDDDRYDDDDDRYDDDDSVVLTNPDSHAKPLYAVNGEDGQKKKTKTEDKKTTPIRSTPSFLEGHTSKVSSIELLSENIDDELPLELRTKYTELCSTQKKSLHENLKLGNESKVAAGIIHATTNIAEAIKTAKLVSDSDQLNRWDGILKAFENEGMDVVFLRDRIHRLQELSNEYHDTVLLEGKRKEREQTKEEIKVLQSKLAKAVSSVLSLDSEIDELEDKRRKIGCSFEEVATAPW